MLRSVHTDRSDSYFVSDFDVGSIGTYSNIIGIGHFIGIGIGQCECTVTEVILDNKILRLSMSLVTISGKQLQLQPLF